MKTETEREKKKEKCHFVSEFLCFVSIQNDGNDWCGKWHAFEKVNRMQHWSASLKIVFVFPKKWRLHSFQKLYLIFFSLCAFVWFSFSFWFLWINCLSNKFFIGRDHFIFFFSQSDSKSVHKQILITINCDSPKTARNYLCTFSWLCGVTLFEYTPIYCVFTSKNTTQDVTCETRHGKSRETRHERRDTNFYFRRRPQNKYVYSANERTGIASLSSSPFHRQITAKNR